MKLLCIFVSLVLVVKANYHDEVGISLAAKIKAFEDKLQNEVPDMESRVVGGEIAPVFDHPFLVGLSIQVLEPRQQSVCGSSLVSKTRLVTAAHCLVMVSSIEAVIGSQYLNYGGIRMDTKNFVGHPNFNRDPYNSDIGIVFLPQPVEYGDLVQPINLPSPPEDNEVIGQWAMAAGWGLTSDDQLAVPIESQVMQVRLKIIPEMECINTFVGTKTEPDGGWICTSGEGGVGTCGGDSGGPLYVERNGSKILIGVTSFGSEDCEIGRPSVFTRVASYLEFIHQHL